MQPAEVMANPNEVESTMESYDVALALVSFMVARGDRIVTDGGTLSLRANGMGATHLVATLDGSDGAVSEYAISLVVGQIR